MYRVLLNSDKKRCAPFFSTQVNGLHFRLCRTRARPLRAILLATFSRAPSGGGNWRWEERRAMNAVGS